jgi:hypothetical protein
MLLRLFGDIENGSTGNIVLSAAGLVGASKALAMVDKASDLYRVASGVRAGVGFFSSIAQHLHR